MNHNIEWALVDSIMGPPTDYSVYDTTLQMRWYGPVGVSWGSGIEWGFTPRRIMVDFTNHLTFATVLDKCRELRDG